MTQPRGSHLLRWLVLESVVFWLVKIVLVDLLFPLCKSWIGG